MVKPPKTMQPEGVNLEKAGRAAGKAFQDDSHRNYMARKIDMQRKQFGLVLPPDPREYEDLQAQTKRPEVNVAPDDPREEQEDREAPPKQPRPEVRFASDVEVRFAPDGHDTNTERPKKRQRKKLGMASVLRRLKRRHGRAGGSNSTETEKEDAVQGCHEAEPEPPGHAALHSESQPVSAAQYDAALPLDSETVKEDAYEGNQEMDPPAPHATLHSESLPVGGTHCDSLPLDSETVKDDAYEGSQEMHPPAPHAALHSWCVSATECDPLHTDSGSTFEKDDESPPPPPKSSVVAAPCVERPKEGALVDHVSTPKSTPPSKRKALRPDLFFAGVVILVNGYTNPDTETLQRLMHKHGGDLEKYETVKLTHIIAEHLSTAKAKIYKRQRRPIPVCSPSWVVDCVEARKLLPHAPYLIKEVRDGDVGMKSVVSYFQGAPAEKKKVKERRHPQNSDIERDGKKAVGYSFQAREMPLADVSEKPGPSMDVEFARQTSSNVTEVSLLESNHSAPLAPPKGESFAAHTENDCVDAVLDTKKPSNSSTKSDDKYINGRVRTTGTDPHFLESFFNQSRLSFIGSYKQRARQTLQKKAARRNGERRFVFHVDMDCFFASVVLRRFPEYQNKPVAICHQGEKRSSGNNAMESPVPKTSTSECATCNYEARKFGGKCLSVHWFER
jgi:hypothetical protein